MSDQVERWWVLLPDGTPIPTTESDTAQSATAKAMMMDIPPGCRVERKSD